MSEAFLEDKDEPQSPEWARRVAGMEAFMRRRNPHIESLHQEAKREREGGNEARASFNAGMAVGMGMIDSRELEAAATAMGYAPSPSPVVEVSEETTFTGRITANVTEEMVEAGAKAIARAKRAPGVSEAVIDRVWPSYVGQSRAALVAALRVR